MSQALALSPQRAPSDDLLLPSGWGGNWRIHSEFPDLRRITGSRHTQEFFELRTVRVVTLCSLSSDDSIPEVQRRRLCATTQLVALLRPIRIWLRSSKPGRQFMRIETNCTSQSKGWESAACCHLIDMLGCDLEQFLPRPAHVRCGFLFPIALSDSYLCPSTEDDSTLQPKAISIV